MKKTILSKLLAVAFAGFISFAGQANATTFSITYLGEQTNSPGVFQYNYNFYTDTTAFDQYSIGFNYFGFSGLTGGNSSYFSPTLIDSTEVDFGYGGTVTLQANTPYAFSVTSGVDSLGSGTFTAYDRHFGANNSGALQGPVAVPEPSTYALLGLGALTLIVVARRKTA